jgi:hypothetical protein
VHRQRARLNARTTTITTERWRLQLIIVGGHNNLGTPLANGASINLSFLLGIQQTGSYSSLLTSKPCRNHCAFSHGRELYRPGHQVAGVFFLLWVRQLHLLYTVEHDKNNFRVLIMVLVGIVLRPERPGSKTSGTWPAATGRAKRASRSSKKTQTIRLAPDLSQLSAGERAAVAKLLEAGKIFQALYEEQRHKQALSSYKNFGTCTCMWAIRVRLRIC